MKRTEVMWSPLCAQFSWHFIPEILNVCISRRKAVTSKATPQKEKTTSTIILTA
jgi:hypothetical protein